MKLHHALARNWPCGDTLGMKTAISIPNDPFDGAERLARRTRRSRSSRSRRMTTWPYSSCEWAVAFWGVAAFHQSEKIGERMLDLAH